MMPPFPCRTRQRSLQQSSVFNYRLTALRRSAYFLASSGALRFIYSPLDTLETASGGAIFFRDMSQTTPTTAAPPEEGRRLRRCIAEARALLDEAAEHLHGAIQDEVLRAET